MKKHDVKKFFKENKTNLIVGGITIAVAATSIAAPYLLTKAVENIIVDSTGRGYVAGALACDEWGLEPSLETIREHDPKMVEELVNAFAKYKGEEVNGTVTDVLD